MQVLAEPNLTTINGQAAKFLAGGEFPFPVIQGSNGGFTSVTIQFRPYGVKLEFTPYVNPDGTIRLKVSPEVSALDYTNAVKISGYTIPAILHAQGGHRNRAQGRSELRHLRTAGPSHHGRFEQDSRNWRHSDPGAAVSFPEPEPFHHRADRHRHPDGRPTAHHAQHRAPGNSRLAGTFHAAAGIRQRAVQATKITPGTAVCRYASVKECGVSSVTPHTEGGSLCLITVGLDPEAD